VRRHGIWSKPYRDAGYDVRLVTLPENDVRNYSPPENVYGILSAPPCIYFTNSGAQYWKIKHSDGRTLIGTQIITHCLRIIAMARSKFWAMENPTGRFVRWMGKPNLVFNFYDYGDPYTKRTCLWGIFNQLKKTPVQAEYFIVHNGDRYSLVHWRLGGNTAKTKEIRSITPLSFARAFFEANQ
jgi:hypothetical protein